MWSLVIMFLYKLAFLLFGVLYTTYGASSSSSSSSELKKNGSDDDDNKLKQALLLVDMLKSEYIKVLHENRQLRHGQTSSTLHPNDESTCAETSGEANTTEPSPAISLQLNGSSLSEPTPVSLLPATAAAPAQPTMDPNATLDANIALHASPPLAVNNSHHGKVLGMAPGRRMMNSMYGDMVNNNTIFRRNMDADPVVLDTSTVESTSSLSTPQQNKSSINSTLLAPTKKVSHKVKVTPNANIVDMDAKLGVAATAPTHKIKDFLKNINASHIKDPLMDQIASELTYELRDDRQGLRAKSTTSENITETSQTSTFLPVKKAWPSTINIWLSKSSKMEFPLSPQVALCVLSPRNALCKTQI